MASASFRSKVVVLLVFQLFFGGFVLGTCFVMQYFGSFLADCVSFNNIRMLCHCYPSLPLPHGAVGLSVV